METVNDFIDQTQHTYLKYSIYTLQINIGNNILIQVVDKILEKADDRLRIIDRKIKHQSKTISSNINFEHII